MDGFKKRMVGVFLFNCILCAANLHDIVYASPRDHDFNVLNYGAAADGVTKDTEAIRKAIETCAAAGGGTVYFPAGRYLTGAVTLRSNILLYIDAGAVLLGSDDPADYPLIESPWVQYTDEQEFNEDNPRLIYSSLINGSALANIGICGLGTIDGQGGYWQKLVGWSLAVRRNQKEKLAGVTEDDLKETEILAYGRPHVIRLVNCENILIEDITIINAPTWTIRPTFCRQMTIHNIKISNPQASHNTDGINPESCSNVHISNCYIEAGDNCITIKSGKDAPGRRAGIPSENITITNCIIGYGGGIAIGSEMSGGVKNVTVSNCAFQNSNLGIRMKSNRQRGGVVENILFENLVMKNVREPIKIDMFYYADAAGGKILVTETTPVFRNVVISNIIANGAEGGSITGLEEMPIDGLTLNNIRMQSKTGLVCKNMKDFDVYNVSVSVSEGPALLLENVQHFNIDGFKAAATAPVSPVIALQNTSDGFIHDCTSVTEVKNYMRIAGSATGSLIFQSNNTSKTAEFIVTSEEVPAGTVTQE